MPVQINYLQGGMGIEFVSLGVVTGKEIIEANERIYNREDLLRLRYKIADRTACTEYRVTAEDVQSIAKQDREAAKINPHIIIVLVSTTPLQYGISRMWQAYIDGIGFQTEIFEDRKSAETWLAGKLRQPGSE